jgi:hypothetical protein
LHRISQLLIEHETIDRDQFDAARRRPSGVAYRALLTWMKKHGHGPAGPPRETCHVSPAETGNPGE